MEFPFFFFLLIIAAAEPLFEDKYQLQLYQ